MMALLKVDPRLDGLHSAPRYADLVRPPAVRENPNGALQAAFEVRFRLR